MKRAGFPKVVSASTSTGTSQAFQKMGRAIVRQGFLLAVFIQMKEFSGGAIAPTRGSGGITSTQASGSILVLCLALPPAPGILGLTLITLSQNPKGASRVKKVGDLRNKDFFK